MKLTCGGVPQALVSMGTRVIAIPQIEFSIWFPWDQRNHVPDCELPGVYALAHFQGAPEGTADPLDPCIRYIGQSCSRGGVRGRLALFDRSARTGKNGHSGGRTYHEKFGAVNSGLYVSVFSVSRLHPVFVRNAYILFVERELIWKFSIAHERLPQCNKC